ncbi:MAG: hypothetical protein Kow00133_14780 [Amphiplicatus sp.]
MSDEDEKKFAERAVYSTIIKAPIEKVWSELVDTASPRPFFFNAKCETPDGMKAGAPYRMITRDGKFVSVVGEILEFEPPYRFVQSFRFTNMDEGPCKVTYTLKETPEGVEFSLITENVPAGTKMEKSMAQGGPFIVENLKSWCERGKPTFAGGLMLAMFGLMAPLTPKVMRAENWPLEKRA